MSRIWLIAALVTGAVSTLGPATAGAPSPTAAHAPPAPAATDAPQQPRCFGAEARDRFAPCRNPALRLSVVPSPAQARTQQNKPCPIIAHITGKEVCSFGVDAARARRSVALVGDSHAGMWRVALGHTALELGWYGVRIGHASCPLSKAVRDLPEPNRSHCARWKRDVFKWFKRHPEISILFVSQLSGGSGVVPTRGRSRFETSVAGYRAAWRSLANIEHVVVIRDTPKAEVWTAGCVERAMAQHKAAGPACGNHRSEAIDADPAAVAARRARGPRFHIVDLTDVFCGPRSCLPVIGGALVHRDTTHLTAAFAASLGNPLLRRVRPLARNWD